MIDLHLLPIHRAGGQDQPGLPGLYVATPPRRAARGRHADQLILFLALAGNAPLSPEYLHEVLVGLAKIYYRTSGTVTAAQRAVADDLNRYLLDRNLRNASTGHQALGLFVQIVLRGERLSLAQCGPAHVFLLASDGAQHLADSHLSGRGLGISRTTTIRYAQADLRPNDALVLASQPPSSWTATTLDVTHRQGPENLQRYLLTQTLPDLSAVLIQVQPGTGQVRLPSKGRAFRPKPAQTPLEQPALKPSAAPRQVEKQPAVAQAKAPPTYQPAGRAASPPLKSVTAPSPPAPRRPARRRSIFAPLLGALGVVWQGLGNFFRRVGRGAAVFARRVLPDESLFTLPASTMFFIAVAVPLVVVAVASVTYFQRGLAAQYDAYYAQAVEAARQADAQTDPQELHRAWEATLKLLNQAEVYRTTPESKALRSQGQGVLDTLDYVERLDFLPALTTPLRENAHISRMVASGTDLYLLNAKEGIVQRAAFTSKGYALDQDFACGPGVYGSQIVGAILAIAPLPAGLPSQATVLGMDSNGNLLYCIPGESPLAASLKSAGTSWGPPESLALDGDDLYLLDPKNNAVWIYRDLSVTEQPRLFFDQDIPPMQDVIDLTVNRDDLFLLHTDGHITKCVFSGLEASPTRCEEPASFADPRPGRQNGPLITGAHFTEVLFTPPPDPSIYMLEPTSQAIYQFGVGLAFHNQFQSNNPLLEEPATAFAINRNNRMVFLAIGDQVFYASLP